jgi:hypothetical protein
LRGRGPTTWAGGRRAACLLAAALLVAVASCRPREAPPLAGGEVPSASTATATPAPVPAGPSATTGSLTVAVERVQRLSRDLIQIDLVAVNTGTAAVELGQALSSAAGGLEQAAFTAESRDSRTFVLRDGDGAPQCSGDLGPLAAGGRRTLFVRFLAFSGGAFTGTLEVPGLSPLSAVAVPASEP